MRKFWILAPACVLLFAFQVLAAKKADSRGTKTTDDATTVELFDAINSGDVEVRVIAKDASAGNVLIKNTTKRPLAIRLPEAFAAVPVAAQFGGPFGGVGGPFGGAGGPFGGNAGMNGMNGMMGGAMNGMNGGMGMNQAVGGGFNVGNGINGGIGNGIGRGLNVGGPGGMPGGLFKVEPEKVGKLKMTTVCLQHGNPDPNAHIEYELRPLDSVVKDQTTIEAVKMLARGEVDQKSAQAAAWHLANGLSWEKLARKIGVKHVTGQVDPFFTAEQIERAKQIASEAKLRGTTKEQEKPVSSASLANR